MVSIPILCCALWRGSHGVEEDDVLVVLTWSIMTEEERKRKATRRSSAWIFIFFTLWPDACCSQPVVPGEHLHGTGLVWYGGWGGDAPLPTAA